MRIYAEGTAAPDTVWSRYTRPEAWAHWAPQMRRVECQDEQVRAGTRGVVRGPGPVRVPFEVIGIDHDARRWTWTVGTPPLSVTMEHGIEPTPGGTRAWVRIPILLAPYAPLARLALRRLVRG